MLTNRLHITLILSLLLLMSCAGNETGTSSHTPDGCNKSELRQLGMTALNKADFATAITAGKKLLQNKSDIESAIYGNIMLGQAYLFSDSMSLCYPHLHEAELLCIKHHNDSALASVYNGLGLYSSNIEKDYPEALKYFFLGIDASKRSENNRLHSLLLSNIASIYALNRDPAGIRYAKECYYHGKETDDKFLQYTGAISSADIYLVLNEYYQALKYIKEAEMLLNSYSINNHATLYYIYGKILKESGDIEGASDCFRKSIIYTNTTTESDIRSYIEYADILKQDGNTRKAIELLDSALMTTAGGYDIMFRADVLKALAATYKEIGYNTQSEYYNRIYHNETDSTDNAEKQTTIQQIRIKYDLERAENELNRQKVTLLEKQNMVNMLTVAVIIVIIISVSVYLLYKRKSLLYSTIVKQVTEAAHEESRLRAAIKLLEEKIAEADSGNSRNDTPEPEEPEENGTANSENRNGGQHSLFDERSQQLIARFESLMLNPEIYTDNLINKDKVAKLLNTNRTYISRIVNDNYHMSFTQFINSLRIKEAVRRLSDRSCSTPLKALAEELGYNSMTTFYTKFHEVTGITPAAFRAKAKNLNNNSPYNLTTED